MKILTIASLFLSISCFASEINIPASALLEAARVLVPQTGPYYSVIGTIKCTSINTGWGPGSSNCIINIKGVNAVIQQSDNIIDSVMEINPPTGPYYRFAGKFSATSIISEVPPYNVTETATIILK
jgi:hypothetical protein